MGLLARALLYVRRALRGLLPGAIVAVPPLFWVVDATYRASLTSLGRDQGIFQYVGWAWMQGQRGYSEVRDVNGPLTPVVHMIFLLLGGREEHRFHTLDLLVTGFVFGLVGVCIPHIARAPRPGAWKTPREMFERLGWAGAAWVVLSGQYLMYIFWDIAQRESFFDWFLLSSIALQLYAQGEQIHTNESKSSRYVLAVAGLLAITTWFGKPTYFLFTLTQLIALLVEKSPMPRRQRLKWFGAGGLVAGIGWLLVMVKYADIGTFIHISAYDVPAMYRFIWPRSAIEIFSLEGYSTTIGLTIASSTIILGLIFRGDLPRRALPIACMPLVGLVSVIAQSKGFPYHFHPVTAGLSLQWLLIVVWVWDRVRNAKGGTGLVRVLPVLCGSILAIRVALLMTASPYIQNLWLYAKANTVEERQQHDYFVYFATSDFFPWELRQTATYLKEHTKPEDRVQTYGMDPYVLFLAERLSATPYIYAYDLDVDSALAGGVLPEPRGLHPTFEQQMKMREIRDAHEKDMLTRLKAAPPAAFVFLDKAPLVTWHDSAHDFEEHSPESYRWMIGMYRETANFNGCHVYLRNDVPAAELSSNPALRDAPSQPASP